MFHLPPDDLEIFAQRFEHKERDLSWSITATYLYLVRAKRMKVTFLPLHLLVQKIAINKVANSTALNSYSKTTCNVFSVPNFQDVVLPQTKQTRTNTWPKFSAYNFLIYKPSRFCFRINTFL